MAGNVPVIGIEGLLALAGTIERLRASRSGGDEGGRPRCQLMQRCPPVEVLVDAASGRETAESCLIWRTVCGK